MSDHLGSKSIRAERFLLCKRCGRKILKKLADGSFEFRYGRRNDKHVVQISVVGKIEIKCFRNDCNYINVFNS